MRFRFLGACALAALCLTPSAGAAAPRIIMVTGESLAEPVFLSNHGENAELMLAFQQAAELEEGRLVDPKELRGRPYLELWLFWGDTRWAPYVREDRLSSLRPEQANQYGRFYPAVGPRSAVMTLDVPGSRKATPNLLRILARHRIPIRAEPVPAQRDESSTGTTWLWIVGGALSALAVAGAAAGWRLRRRPAV